MSNSVKIKIKISWDTYSQRYQNLEMLEVIYLRLLRSNQKKKLGNLKFDDDENSDVGLLAVTHIMVDTHGN